MSCLKTLLIPSRMGKFSFSQLSKKQKQKTYRHAKSHITQLKPNNIFSSKRKKSLIAYPIKTFKIQILFSSNIKLSKKNHIILCIMDIDSNLFFFFLESNSNLGVYI